LTLRLSHTHLILHLMHTYGEVTKSSTTSFWPTKVSHLAEDIHATTTRYRWLKRLLRLMAGVLSLRDCRTDNTRSSSQLHSLIECANDPFKLVVFMLTRSIPLAQDYTFPNSTGATSLTDSTHQSPKSVIHAPFRLL